MPYSFPTVAFATATGRSIVNPTNLGLPATFPCLLFSGWITAPNTATSWFFGGNSIPFQSFYIAPLSTSMNIVVNDASNLTIGIATIPLTWAAGTFAHVLVSVDAPNHRMQLYINDVAQTVSPFWVSANPIGRDTRYTLNSGGPQSLCAGDIWFSNQSTFTDLTVTANRRKFISASGTPIDLGATGQIPFGAAPPVFLHVPTAGVAPDFTANAGTGGAFSPDLAFGACGVFPAFTTTATVGELFFAPTTSFVDMSLEANRRKFVTAVGATQDLYANGTAPFGAQPPVFLTRYTGAAPDTFAANAGNGGMFVITGGDLTDAATAPPCAFEGTGSPWTADAPIVWLRWSDDRGRTWSNPIPQSIGATGQYLVQPSWSRLGCARDRVFEVYGSVPGRFAVQGAWLDPPPIPLKS